jgi:hypothetical protein
MMFKLQKKPSTLKREHQALHNMKFLIFSIFVGHFCPGTGYGSTDLIESGSETLRPFIHFCASISYIIFFKYSDGEDP